MSSINLGLKLCLWVAGLLGVLHGSLFYYFYLPRVSFSNLPSHDKSEGNIVTQISCFFC